jgi:adenylate cyclase
MNQEEFKRKLTAILSADVEGYSRLMGEDEDGTIRTLTSYRELMSTLIQKHRGRVVDSPGDNLLAEFGSVVDAVRCAVEVQEELRVRNAELPENRRMEFRIGINLGDVVEEGERIYGDGVNITARVEGLAEGGGICISGTVYDSIKNKLSLSYESLGEHTVKNIAEPVRVYRMRIGPEAAAPMEREEKKKPRRWRWAAIGGAAVLLIIVGGFAIWSSYFRPPPLEVASVDKMAFHLPDEPSIAVLPFVNLSGDPKQEYFSDGITEQIITTLSKVPQMLVIARNSTFVYKGKPVKVSQVGEELGVKYVLEGSVQKSGNRVRITAQLIDITKGHHLWAERYDRNLSDIFALQDEIAKKVITALQVKLTEGEKARLWAKGTENLEAYLKFLQGIEHYRQRNPDDLILARQFLGEAIALDPEYADPFIFMGQIHLTEVRQGLSKSPEESIDQAFELAQKALSLDELHPDVHTLLGWGYLNKRQYEKGITACERAVALNPNHTHSLFFLGIALSVTDRPHEAIPYFEKALRLNPLDPAPALFGLGDTYRVLGRYEEAIPKLKKALTRRPKSFPTLLNLAACYSALGREEEAHAVVEQILKLNPEFSLERFAKTMLHRGAVKERYLAALRKAGLPETPPLPLPDKPSIAVLPFVNMSGDPEQEYFSDGITEEIITALSKVPDLFVIARNSSFTYKGKSVRIPTVGRELGVRYVLEGSVRKAGEKVRVTAQLVDAKTGNHLWAERYDRDLKDIFALQDEITMKIITAMQVKLTEGEQARVFGKGTNNLEAYLKRLQAREYAAQLNKEDNALARKLAEEAISLDPEYAGAYVTLGGTHWLDIILGSSKSSKESLKRAFELTTKAIALDDSNADGHVSLSFIYMMKRQHDKGVAEAERAVELAPGLADAQFNMARVLRYAGRAEEAITWNKKAIRQDPMPFGPYLMGLAHAYWMVGRYEEALLACKKAVLRSPKNTFSHMVMVATYISLGREEEARAEAKEVLRIDPKFSLAHWGKTLPFKNQTDRERFFAALGKAGLK